MVCNGLNICLFRVSDHMVGVLNFPVWTFFIFTLILKQLSDNWKPQIWTLSSLKIKASVFTFNSSSMFFEVQKFRAGCIRHPFSFFTNGYCTNVFWQSSEIDCFVFHPYKLRYAYKTYRSLFLFRPHAVKPLSTADKQPDLRETQDASRSAKSTDDLQVKMKVAWAFFSSTFV